LKAFVPQVRAGYFVDEKNTLRLLGSYWEGNSEVLRGGKKKTFTFCQPKLSQQRGYQRFRQLTACPTSWFAGVDIFGYIFLFSKSVAFRMFPGFTLMAW